LRNFFSAGYSYILREEKSALYPRKSWVVWKMKREVFSEPVLVWRKQELDELESFLVQL
jgi:hypothetical protein